MLAFDHIPTGSTINQGLGVDEVNGSIQPAVAPTAIGADIETDTRVTPHQGYTLRSGSSCPTFGVHLTPADLPIRGYEQMPDCSHTSVIAHPASGFSEPRKV
jgi:hypothetical protein